MSDKKDSAPRPKRIKKDEVIVISSSSDSDSDENVGVAGSRRKKLQVAKKTALSSVDGRESSGSSVVFVKKRRRVSSFSSDGSEGNSNKCSICLLRFTSQKVGTPQSCEHLFCLDCILEWSKNVNTCPVDRKLFKSIVVRACAGGRVLRTQPVGDVERTQPVVDVDDSSLEVDFEDLPYCEVCRDPDREENLLLCGRCDTCCHMRCIIPPLPRVPLTWYCTPCRNLDDGWIDPIEMEMLLP